MRKISFLGLIAILAFCFAASAQNKKVQKINTLTPYTEVLYQTGLCGTGIPVSFIAGVEKPFAKHWSMSYDLQVFKTDYEMYCCDVYSKGTYSTVIPSAKIKFDPGKRNKGIFIGAGLGYVFARDRGTEQTYDNKTGAIGKDITNGNWDFNSIAPSFSWGIGFKIHKFPMAFVNTNYFAKSTDGFGPIAVGMGLKIGFKKDNSKSNKCGEKKKTKTSKCVQQKYRCSGRR